MKAGLVHGGVVKDHGYYVMVSVSLTSILIILRHRALGWAHVYTLSQTCAWWERHHVGHVSASFGGREGCGGPGQMIKWAGIGNHSDKGGRGITCLPNFLKSANSLFSQLVSAGAVKGWFIASCYSTLRGSISLKSSLKFLCFKKKFLGVHKVMTCFPKLKFKCIF